MPSLITKQMVKGAPMLSREKEIELVLKAKAGDQRSRDLLVSSFLRLAFKEVHRWRKIYGTDKEDLGQQAVVAILKAIEKYDCNKGFRFGQYAQGWMRTMLRDWVLRTTAAASGGATSDSTLNVSRYIYMEKKRGRIFFDMNSAQAERVSQLYKIAVEDVLKIEKSQDGYASFDSRIRSSDPDSRSFYDQLADTRANQEEKLIIKDEKKKRALMLAEELTKFNGRDRDIFCSYFGLWGCKKVKLKELGDRHGISAERVRQIKNDLFQRIFRNFGGREEDVYMFTELATAYTRKEERIGQE